MVVALSAKISMVKIDHKGEFKYSRKLTFPPFENDVQSKPVFLINSLME